MANWTAEAEQRLRDLHAANVTEDAIMFALGKNLAAYRSKCLQLGLDRRSFDRPRYPNAAIKRVKKGQGTLPKLASEM